MLPETYQTVLHWSEQQRQMLTGTAALAYWEQAVKPRWESFLNSMRDAYEWYPKVFGFTEEGLKWAFSTLATRAWEFPHSKDLETLLGRRSPHLLPLADMVNHDDAGP